MSAFSMPTMSLLRHGVLWLLIPMLLWCAAPAQAATIGPTLDWISVDDAASALDLDQDSLSQILRAGVVLTCPGTQGGAPSTLNGWMMGDESSTLLVTNAHGFYTKDGTPRLPFEDCSWLSLSELVAYSKGSPYPKKHTLGHATVTVAGTIVNSHMQDDRAIAALAEPPEGMNILPMKRRAGAYLGRDVFLLSRAPYALESRAFTGAIIQQCTIRKSVPIWNKRPAAIVSDCDNQPGISGGLYLVREKNGDLVSLAIHVAGREEAGDLKKYDEKRNSAIGIVLDDQFFVFVH